MKKNKRSRRILIGLVLLLSLVVLATTVSVSYAAAPDVAPAQSGVYHTVHYGEYLSLIAQRYGTSVQAILNANPHIVNPNVIYAGTVLFIPSGYHHTPGYGGYCRYQHYVSYGDNLIRIGRYYGVSPFAIAEANHIYNLNHIYAGQYLCIP